MPGHGKRFTVELGEQEREIAYDLEALLRLSELLGLSVEELNQSFEGGLTGQLKALRAFVWAGVLHADPLVTPEEVGRWITGRNLEAALRAVDGAFRWFWGADEPAGDAAGKATRRPRGTSPRSSGRSTST